VPRAVKGRRGKEKKQFTTEDTEVTEEDGDNKGQGKTVQMQFTTEDAEDTEEEGIIRGKAGRFKGNSPQRTQRSQRKI